LCWCEGARGSNTALGRSGAAWPESIAHLDSLTKTEVDYDGNRLVICAPPRSPAWPCGPPPSHCRGPSARLGRPNPRPLTCSAKPPALLGVLSPVNYLANRTVEDVELQRCA
jgi:hypothetical protein